MNYKEMLTKTGMQIVGICKELTSFTPKDGDKTFYSVFLEIQGCRQPVKVKLPDDFNHSQLKEYELCKMACIVKPSFNGKSIDLVAVP